MISLNVDCPEYPKVKVAFQGIDENLSWGQEGIEGSGSEGAGVGEPLISAPQLNTALVITIEDPRIFPPTPGSNPSIKVWSG